MGQLLRGGTYEWDFTDFWRHQSVTCWFSGFQIMALNKLWIPLDIHWIMSHLTEESFQTHYQSFITRSCGPHFIFPLISYLQPAFVFPPKVFSSGCDRYSRSWVEWKPDEKETLFKVLWLSHGAVSAENEDHLKHLFACTHLNNSPFN